jgi:hypothetical protein
MERNRKRKKDPSDKFLLVGEVNTSDTLII